MHDTVRLTVITIMLAGCATPAPRAPAPASAPAPADALSRLKDGNALFVANPATRPSFTRAQREATVKGQWPIAMVLSCADSRVPPEIVFDQNPGDLFVVRVAGEALDRSAIASLEYGAEHLHIPLIVVLGHEGCGAVKAAIETSDPQSLGPNLEYLVAQITPSFEDMKVPADAAHMREAVQANTAHVTADLLGRSALVHHMHDEGKLRIVGAYYELASGRVVFQ